mmetsp:Transcript_2323/g.3730  ORF Transcript_2323/g.3730 Transcript_2323/m.3730 type:complete len:134 (+) Transcript_2323:32-433(+)
MIGLKKRDAALADVLSTGKKGQTMNLARNEEIRQAMAPSAKGSLPETRSPRATLQLEPLEVVPDSQPLEVSIPREISPRTRKAQIKKQYESDLDVNKSKTKSVPARLAYVKEVKPPTLNPQPSTLNPDLNPKP